MRKQRVVVMVSAGPVWQSGPPEAQPGWDKHAVFVDRLVDEGTFIMGGPFSDNSGSMSVLDGLTADEAQALMQTDPFVENGVFVVEDIRDWTVYVDAFAQP